MKKPTKKKQPSAKMLIAAALAWRKSTAPQFHNALVEAIDAYTRAAGRGKK